MPLCAGLVRAYRYRSHTGLLAAGAYSARIVRVSVPSAD